MAHVERRVRTGKDGTEGSVRWRACYRGPGGRQRSKTFVKKSDAERWLAVQTADVAKGVWVDPTHSRMTFAEWVPMWEDTLAHLRPRTKQLNVGVARNYLVPRFGEWPLARLATSDVQEMMNEELAEGRLSNSAIRRHVMVLAQVLDGAVQQGRLGRNVARGVKLPPEHARQMRFLTAEEVAHLADSIEPFYRPMVLTAAYVGLRWGELTGLALTSVDPLRKTMRVDRQLQDINGEMTFVPPKTRAGTRTVSVPGTLIDILAPHFATPQVQSSGLAFPGAKGQRLRNGTFRRIWLQAVEAAGFEGFVFHELRHTSAALAIAQGAHPMAIKERLGHASITTTLDRYGGLFPSLDRQVADGLDQVLADSIAS